METRTQPTRTRSAPCSQCNGAVELKGRLLIGEVFDCPTCRAPLEIANIEPVELEPFARIDDDTEDFELF